jgi:hypothetical protein
MVLFFLLCAPGAQAQESIATLKSVSGQVWVVRDGDSFSGQPNMDLVESDTLATGADSAAGVSFMDGTRISLGPSSEMEIKSYHFAPRDKDYAFDVHFQKGTAVYSSGRLGKLSPEDVQLSTPQAVLGIRGTTFLVRVE